MKTIKPPSVHLAIAANRESTIQTNYTNVPPRKQRFATTPPETKPNGDFWHSNGEWSGVKRETEINLHNSTTDQGLIAHWEFTLLMRLCDGQSLDHTGLDHTGLNHRRRQQSPSRS
jgi:hypothetical protein